MKLTPAQQRAKDAIRRAREAQKIARSAFDTEMEIAWRERSAQVNQAVLTSVQEAVRLGIPVRQIGDAYGSKDYNTVRRIIDTVNQMHQKVVETSITVLWLGDNRDRFIIDLRNFNDWTDATNTEPVTGSVVYVRDLTDLMGTWFPEEHTDVSRAVERELWVDSPLRAEVAKHVDLDSLESVDDTDDEDSELPGMWERADFA